MRGLRIVSVALCLWLALPAARVAAEPATEAFHDSVAGAYRHYREAVHYFETGNTDLAGLALDEFIAAWRPVVERYAGNPPPGYAKDPAFAAVLAVIAGRAARAKAAKPDEVLDALTPLRADLAELRRYNGQHVFSDCVDQMNDAMDRLWRLRHILPKIVTEWDHYAATQRMQYFYDRCRDRAPPAVRDSAEFQRLVGGALASLARLDKATDADTIRSLLRELRSFDKLIWLRFG